MVVSRDASIIGFLSLRLELRCVMAIVRHADRTPKQKMKMVVTHERLVVVFKRAMYVVIFSRFFQLADKHNLSKRREIKLKAPTHLQV